jgi:hypothetical protein
MANQREEAKEELSNFHGPTRNFFFSEEEGEASEVQRN